MAKGKYLQVECVSALLVVKSSAQLSDTCTFTMMSETKTKRSSHIGQHSEL